MNDKLDKYSSNYPPLEKRELPKLVEKKEGYEAFVKTKGMERTDVLRIEFKNGDIDFFHYNHLIKGSIKSGTIILTTTTGIYTISGQQLSPIVELLSDRKIKSLIEYNPATHELTGEKKKSIIEQIENED